jgi:uncharacterized protein YndB with AHSA1/START domain
MNNTFELSITLPASPQRLYTAWLDSKEHSAFTGGKAKIQPKVGGKFTAWDGYILGTTTELEPYRRIVQTWRTTEFPEGSSDSRLEVLFEEVAEGTKLTLKHSLLPQGQAEEYYQGWIDNYFEPMKKYFK